MQFKVPQDVQRADKILGPLTVRGFLTALGGGALAYIAYLTLNASTWPFVAIIIISLTAALIFLRIHDMSFTQYLFSLLIYVFRPQRRLWVQHAGDISIPLSYQPELAVKKAEKVEEKAQKTIAALAEELAAAEAKEKERFKEVGKPSTPRASLATIVKPATTPAKPATTGKV
ncbi:MAG: hypothetical protein A2788_01425 [Candidatus Abawacabacteria bacterium RIFCSPHIGHO2_01_FULL_46_8]|uniref:PrgI family protein n=1 Tax=Candidatus Abawacabacteria bacterium RIFCSPHIGHO2_01_FULL_46_8 TaxID=1817815 RepID=A0A1F4XN53_9BACT|nr:MAG: hypothetical protein A2788_01425 [Candidatus Abawacabacteria bacterium RIFCSPHIGHO2_01_FULL_46_8]